MRRTTTNTARVRRQRLLAEFLGADLAVLRHRAQLTQQQLAAELGTSREFLSALERGCSSPALPTLLRLRALFVEQPTARAA